MMQLRSILRAGLLVVACSTILAAANAAPLAAQTYLAPLVGLHGFGTIYGELGVAYFHVERGHVPLSAGYSASVEVSPGPRTVIAPEVNAWFTFIILNVGVSFAYYTDGHEGGLRFRPEIGVGGGEMRIVYGYNFALINYELGGVNRHEMSLRWTYPLIQLQK